MQEQEIERVDLQFRSIFTIDGATSVFSFLKRNPREVWKGWFIVRNFTIILIVWDRVMSEEIDIYTILFEGSMTNS